MRRGKEIAQASHASMAFLTRRLFRVQGEDRVSMGALTEAEERWVNDSFRKITCKVSSEEELLEVHRSAKRHGLESHLITDNGRTEFNNVPTHTCVAIGPDYDDKIDLVTKDLELY